MSLRSIQLQEWNQAELVLDAEELAELQATPAKLIIQPRGGRYVVTPHSIVGAVTTRRLQVIIEPKLPIDRIFSLLGYANGFRFPTETTTLGSRGGIVESFVAAFLAVLQRALRRGVPMSYVACEDGLPTIRGRIRFGDQLKRRYELPVPVEVSYDDFTIDTEANRLVKAALRRITRLRLRDAHLGRRTVEALGAFEGVADVSFDPRRLPRFNYTRIDQPYQPVLQLATLLVRNTSVDLHPGSAPTVSIMFDMNKIFEEFVCAAIGDELRRIMPANYRWRQRQPVLLDQDARLRPQPDLSLWRGSSCVFVGDAKYKTTERGETADLFQLLAYCSATGLDEGTLLYAEKPSGPTLHQVVRGGPRLRVETVDVTAPIDKLLGRTKELAAEIARRALAVAVA